MVCLGETWMESATIPDFDSTPQLWTFTLPDSREDVMAVLVIPVAWWADNQETRFPVVVLDARPRRTCNSWLNVQPGQTVALSALVSVSELVNLLGSSFFDATSSLDCGVGTTTTRQLHFIQAQLRHFGFSRSLRNCNW
jgi:hypothetical protein